MRHDYRTIGTSETSNVEAAADALEALIDSWDTDAVVSREEARPPDEDSKAVDPFSIGALVLSIPPAVLAVADLADRINKRRRAKQLVEHAKAIARPPTSKSSWSSPMGVVRSTQRNPTRSSKAVSIYDGRCYPPAISGAPAASTLGILRANSMTTVEHPRTPDYPSDRRHS